GAGGIQRKLPVGGAAYGIPKNLFTPFSTNPRTGPSAVLTVGPFAFLTCPGASGFGPGIPPGPANAGAEVSTTPATAVMDTNMSVVDSFLYRFMETSLVSWFLPT